MSDDAGDCGAIGAPRQVLMVLDHFYPYVGGAETLFWELARGLAAGGSHVSVVTMHQHGVSAHEVVEGVEVFRVPVPRWAGRLGFVLRAIPRVFRESRHAELIHAAMYAAIFPAWMAAVLRRKQLIVTVYEVFAEQWHRLPGVSWLAGWTFRIYEWLLLRLPVARYVCLSDFTKRRLLASTRVRKSAVSVVHAAVDYDFWNPARHRARPLRQEQGWPRDAFVYLCMGRPGVSKGIQYLLDAADVVSRELPASHLVLLLSREPRAGRRRVEEQIRRLNLSPHVLFLDPVAREDLPGYLLAADCVVVPSLSEGFGYAAVEARSLGCRVLSTRGHAVEEVLAGDVELCPVADGAAMAEKLIAISRDRRPVGVPPMRYGLTRHCTAMVDVYRQVLQRR